MSKICTNCGKEMKDDAVCCLHCGTKFGEPKAEEKKPDSVPKPKMSKKKILIMSCIGLLALIICGGGYFGYSLANGSLYQNGTLRKIYDISGICLQHHYLDADCVHPERCEFCGHEQGEAKGHLWKEATCKYPKTCSICEETEGSVAEHTWEEATCDKPKTCSVCEETEGEPKGHLVRMGLCERCNEYQYELLGEFSKVCDYAADGSKYIDYAIDAVTNRSSTSVFSAYLACSSASVYFGYAKDYYQKACDACKDYSEFAQLKKHMKAVVNSFPTKDAENDRDSCVEYMKKMENVLNVRGTQLEYQLDLIKSWKYTE